MAAGDVTITAANVRPTNSTQLRSPRVVFGETVTAGQWVYRRASDSKFLRAFANGTLEQSGGSTELYWALTGGAVDERGEVAIAGKVIVGGTLVKGKVYVLSDTIGLITLADDLTSSWYSSVAGYASSTTELDLILRADGYQLA